MQNKLDEKHIEQKHIGLKSQWMKNTLDKTLWI